ncbi:MAG: hypothetical protein ABJB66_13915, partial [Gemmatimonadaceae bacterium]
MRRANFCTAACLSLVAFVAMGSQVIAQSAPRVYDVSIVATTDSATLSDVSRIAPLRNGKIVVNDAKRRRLLLFDSTLRLVKVVADTNTGSVNRYGIEAGTGALVPYVGDSSLMLDGASRTLVVIGPDGKFIRSMAPVHQSDLMALARGVNNAAATDKGGRLIIRGPTAPIGQGTKLIAAGDTDTIVTPDSTPILREDFERRTVDTLAFVHVPKTTTILSKQGNRRRITNEVNPLPTTDEWVMLPDGTVAIVRSHDYHVDWVSPNKKMSSSPKLPFDWKRVSDENRVAIVDSTNRELLKQRALDGTSITFSVAVKPADLPEYFPPISPGQVHADPDGNIWILPTTSLLAGKGLVYDVVNRDGVLYKRVRLPEKRLLVGLGAGGAVYMRTVIRPGVVTL